MSTIPRKFFSGALPGRPAVTAGIGAADPQPLRFECNAHAQCVFAEHLNKGVFFAKRLRIARSAVAQRRVAMMWSWSVSHCSGVHKPPTIGSPIRHRTTRFAQKLRELFPPAHCVADARGASDRVSTVANRDACRRGSHSCEPARTGDEHRERSAAARQAWDRLHVFKHHPVTEVRAPIVHAETTMPAWSNPAGIACCCLAIASGRNRPGINALRLPAARRSRPGRAVR